MKSNILKRDYPLSETNIGDDEGKKKVSDVKKAIKVEKPKESRLQELRRKREGIRQSTDPALAHWLDTEMRNEIRQK